MGLWKLMVCGLSSIEGTPAFDIFGLVVEPVPRDITGPSCGCLRVIRHLMAASLLC